jgi:hypothetical protein
MEDIPPSQDPRRLSDEFEEQLLEEFSKKNEDTDFPDDFFGNIEQRQKEARNSTHIQRQMAEDIDDLEDEFIRQTDIAESEPGIRVAEEQKAGAESAQFQNALSG